MNEKNQNLIIAVFGKKGSGKTTLVKNLIRQSKRLIVIDTLNEYNVGEIVYSKENLFNQTRFETFRIVYRPLSEIDADFAFRLCQHLENVTIVVEEADNYATSNYLSEDFRYLIHYGRHYKVNIIVSCRQANRLRSDITAQSDYIISFKQQGRHCLSYMEDFDDKNIILKIDKLHLHEYIFVRGENTIDNLSCKL